MINFHETVMGRRFFEGTMPKLIKIIDELVSAKKEETEAIKAQTEAIRANTDALLGKTADGDARLSASAEPCKKTNAENLSGDNNLELLSCLVISTGHLTESTREAMEYGSDNFWHGVYAYSYEEGFFVSLAEKPTEKIPEDLARCVDFAMSKGCRLIRFDRDADYAAELPIME